MLERKELQSVLPELGFANKIGVFESPWLTMVFGFSFLKI